MEVLWKMEICMRKCKEEVAWVCYLIEFLWCRPTRSPREELGPQNLGGKGCGGRCCREMFWSVGSWRAGWVWGWWADVSDKEWRRLTCGAGSYTHCTYPTPGVTTGLILPAAENLVLHRGPQPAGVSEAHFPQVVDFLWVFTACSFLLLSWALKVRTRFSWCVWDITRHLGFSVFLQKCKTLSFQGVSRCHNWEVYVWQQQHLW